MRRSVLWASVIGSTLVASAGGAATGESTAADSARSRIVIERTCWNTIDRSVVTLFANGTVRRKHSGRERPELWLGELTPEQLRAFVARLSEPNMDESGSGVEMRPEGDWIEHCELDLRLDGRAPWRFSYGQFDSLPLAVAQLGRVIEDLALEADQQVGMSRLPERYLPAVGDLLRRRDGATFRVVGFTVDKRGVELSGTTVPLTLFVAVVDLPREFDALLGSDFR